MQKLRTSETSKAAVAGFSLMLLLPSLDIPLKYTGIVGMVVYLVLGLLGLMIAYYFVCPYAVSRLSEPKALLMLAIAVGMLAVFALLLYPVANSGRFGGGTDVDDALIIGVNELAGGRYPYYQRTYLGGLLSPMPGTIFLAFPFVLLGLLPLQNIFWLGALAIGTRIILGSWITTLMVLLTVMLVSPTAYQVLATGSDHVSNAIYILIAMWLLVRAISDAHSSFWARLFPALLLGIGLSSRSNFLILTPVLFSALLQNSSLGTTLRYCALAGIAFLGVTVPFVLYDPGSFSPYLVQAGRLVAMESVLPHAPAITTSISIVLAVGFSFTRMRNDCAELFRNCAIIQLIVLYLSSLIYAASLGQFSLFLGNIGYGMFTIFFASVSIWIYLSRSLNTSVRASGADGPELAT